MYISVIVYKLSHCLYVTLRLQQRYSARQMDDGIVEIGIVIKQRRLDGSGTSG